MPGSIRATRLDVSLSESLRMRVKRYLKAVLAGLALGSFVAWEIECTKARRDFSAAVDEFNACRRDYSCMTAAYSDLERAHDHLGWLLGYRVPARKPE